MVTLTRKEKVEWRLQSQRIPGNGIPPDFKYTSIGLYTCGVCKIKYYYKYGDPESPQTHTLRRITKLGYGIGIQVCHSCFHEKGYQDSLVKHSSKCRICELNHANRVASRRAKADAKLAAQEGKSKQKGFGTTKQIPTIREPERNGSSVPLPQRRASLKHKKTHRSR